MNWGFEELNPMDMARKAVDSLERIADALELMVPLEE